MIAQWTIAISVLLSGAKAADRPAVIVVVGAAGQAQYGKQFSEWAARWEQAASKAGAGCLRIGSEPPGDKTDRQSLETVLAEEPRESSESLWLVLVGHGTFDGRNAKFNLRGPDLTAAELAEWLKPFKRPVAVINCASSSAPWINSISGPNRIVVTATKSGYEQNLARFGDYLSSSIMDPANDLDKDGQTSLLEAFLSASRRAAEFYQQEARLATETALLDDNGDSLGTPAAWFRGIRATRRAKDGASLDGALAHQWHLVRTGAEENMPAQVRARRDELEKAIAALGETKGQFQDEGAYYGRLEQLLVELARLYAQAEAK